MQVTYNTLERVDGVAQATELTLTVDPISLDFKTGIVRGTVLDEGIYKGKIIDAKPITTTKDIKN